MTIVRHEYPTDIKVRLHLVSGESLTGYLSNPKERRLSYRPAYWWTLSANDHDWIDINPEHVTAVEWIDE